MIELELKAVMPDAAALESKVRAAGGREEFVGRMIDHRLDYADGSLTMRDEVVRVRVYEETAGRSRTLLEWKGPASVQGGYKTREEIAVSAGDARIVLDILGRLGLTVTRSIERDIKQFTLDGAMVRLEHYQRMDDLVEVEGDPQSIERAVAKLGIPRAEYSSGNLDGFVDRYVARTGGPAITGRLQVIE